MVNFDFHEIAFAVPLLAFSLSALVRRRLRPAVAWALPLVFVKEDQGFTVAAIGLVIAGTGLAVQPGERPPGTPDGLRPRSFVTRPGPLARGRPPEPPMAQGPVSSRAAGARAPAAARLGVVRGLLLAVWGLAWSVLAIVVIIPHFNPMHHYPYWYDGGVVGPGGHPSVSALVHQLTQAGHEKLWTTFLILLPVAFLALRSPLVLIALPSLALRFVSTNSYFWGTGWHYDATVMPIVFLAAVDAMAAFRAGSLRRPAPRPAPCHALAARPRGGGGPVRRRGDGRDRRLAGVPVPARRTLWNPQTYEITPHVSADGRGDGAGAGRRDGGGDADHAGPAGRPRRHLLDRHLPQPGPAYVVFDEDNSGWSPPPANVLAFVEQRHPGWSYLRIFADDGVYVFRRAGRTGG